MIDETALRLDMISLNTSIQSTIDPICSDEIEILRPLVAVRSSGGTDFLALAFVVTAAGTPRSVDIDREYRWVPVSQIRSFLLDERVYPLNRPMIEAYLSQSNV